MAKNQAIYTVLMVTVIVAGSTTSILLAPKSRSNDGGGHITHSQGGGREGHREGRQYREGYYRGDRGGLFGGGGVLGTSVGARGQYYYEDGDGEGYYVEESPGLIGGIVEGAVETAEGAAEVAGNVAADVVEGTGEAVYPTRRYYRRGHRYEPYESGRRNYRD